MNSNIWFELKYRDVSFRKYRVVVHNLQQENHKYWTEIEVLSEDNQTARFNIEFTESWIIKFKEFDHFINAVRTENGSPLIEHFLRDFLPGRRLEELDKMPISFRKDSPYSAKVFRKNGDLLDFARDPVIIAKENKLARQIVLKELYFIENSRGPSAENHLIESCSFYNHVIRNAIDKLKDRHFIEIDKNSNLKLSFEGSIFVENDLLSPFNDKIFLVAACQDDIYKLIDNVYTPAVRESGYELKFQEKSEPRGSIHDEIWEYIENCKLSICDLTYSRPNCFIEYGYALAKEKQIILCVEESQGKTKKGLIKVPFDTQTQKYSFWKREWVSQGNSAELAKFKEEIKERIEMKLRLLEVEREL